MTYVVSGGEVDHGKPRPTLARNIREAGVVVGNSKHITQMLRDRMRVEASTVYDGIDRCYFFPAQGAKRDETLRALLAGPLRPYKRPAIVVQQVRSSSKSWRLAGNAE